MPEFVNIKGVMGAAGEQRPKGGEGGKGGEHLSMARQGVEHNDIGRVMLRCACQSPWDFVPHQITRGYWDAPPSYLSFIVEVFFFLNSLVTLVIIHMRYDLHLMKVLVMKINCYYANCLQCYCKWGKIRHFKKTPFKDNNSNTLPLLRKILTQLERNINTKSHISMCYKNLLR